MRRAVGGTWNVPEERILPALAVLAVSFLLGGLAGCLMSTFVGGAGQETATKAGPEKVQGRKALCEDLPPRSGMESGVIWVR